MEHTYAACLLAALLAGEAIPELGDHLKVSVMRLQARDVSAIDDIVVEGHDAHGVLHRASVGVRRDPKLVRSDSSSVPLIRDYLRIVTDNWQEVRSGRWSLVLAVGTTRAAHREFGELAALARSVPDSARFSSAVARSGTTNSQIRNRLAHIADLVDEAAGELPTELDLTAAELTWRLLSGMKIRHLRLEGSDTSDRIAAINALKSVVTDHAVEAADLLFLKVSELTASWAARGAVITEAMLRKQLSAYGLKRSLSHGRAWDVMDRLAMRLRDSIRPGLGSVGNFIELEREAERASLEACIRNMTAGGSIVVTGEPDVGKSALSLRVMETLRDGGAAVASLSLRDLPASVSDFEDQLGGSGLDEVLTTGEAQPRRLLLIDGSEAVLEGKGNVFRALATAALKADLGVIAVTRTDGARQVREDLLRASEVARISYAPVEHVVGPLSEEERRSLPSKFGVLARLNGDSRADWLLGRPGLVDALLRSGTVVEPMNVLCEADVFSAVWRGLVRRDERREPGMTTAEDRENAVLAVARRTLGLVAVRASGASVAELKSDGVLRIPNDPAFSSGDEFSTDLFRDFSLCRLFLTEGWGILTEAGAPRWSIRAARLACQAYLLRGDRHQSWSLLSREFGSIARTMGSRWAEVPYEALLTLSDAESAIHELWTKLEEADFSGLRTLLRLAEQRYVQGTFGDPFALAPVVKAVFVDQPLFNRGSGANSSGLSKAIRQLVLAWTRGVASAQWGEEELRQDVRDVVLAQSPPLYDEFAVELLATLGPDIDDRTEAWLREVASQRPDNLHPAVESTAVAISMSATHPNLLLDLAESYYVEVPEPKQSLGRMGLFDDGIRDFKHGLGLGLGVPQSAWYYGPFFRLLNTVPLDALAFINRMLNHATTFRVQRDTESLEPDGLWLDITGTGQRFYHGDSQVWAWYRGSGVGPHACMSALLALERFVDHLYEEAQVGVPRIFELLLEDCTNIAVPGLLFGFLTRHADLVGDRLDAFLSHPEVWHFETARTTTGISFRSSDGDAENLTGADRRAHTPHDTVGTMVINARLRGDHARLAELANIGSQLVLNARKKSPRRIRRSGVYCHDRGLGGRVQVREL